MSLLVLSRKLGERIGIRIEGRMVWISLLEIREQRVRLGIEAPREMDIHREEIWAKIVAAEAAEEAARPTRPIPSRPDIEVDEQEYGNPVG